MYQARIACRCATLSSCANSSRMAFWERVASVHPSMDWLPGLPCGKGWATGGPFVGVDRAAHEPATSSIDRAIVIIASCCAAARRPWRPRFLTVEMGLHIRLDTAAPKPSRSFSCEVSHSE